MDNSFIHRLLIAVVFTSYRAALEQLVLLLLSNWRTHDFVAVVCLCV